MSLRGLFWKLNHRFNPRHRYNRIKLGLRPGYYDPVIRLETAIFEETKRWFESAPIAWEDPCTSTAWGDRSATDENWPEYWESKKRDADKFKAAIAFWDENRGRITRDNADDIREEATEHLCNILRLRGHMWYP